MKSRATNAAQAVSNAKDFVRYVMDKFPKTVGDDQLLLLAVWNEQGLRLTPAQIAWIVGSGMKSETVRRYRQEIVAEGYIARQVDPALFDMEPTRTENRRDESCPG